MLYYGGFTMSCIFASICAGVSLGNAVENMEFYPLDLFAFISKLLLTKHKKLAHLVSFVYLAAIAKLKPKSITIESISVEKLEELVCHSRYKFDFLGDLQSCALLSINTLAALSASNKSWLRITKLCSNLQDENTENSMKLLWKISMPSVKLMEEEVSKGYLIQCLCISNAPKDFVLYVTDVKLFNIFNYWNKSKSFCEIVSKVQAECRVENKFPSIATSAAIAGIFTKGVRAEDCKDILDEYFMTPRLLKVGEVICINLLKNGNHSGFYKSPEAYFKVITLQGQSNEQQFYVVKGYTDLYLKESVQSYLPPKNSEFIKSVNQIPGFEITKCPDGLRNYFNKLCKIFKLLIMRKNIEGKILLTGVRGSGKKTTLKAVCSAFGLNLVQVNCFDFYEKNPSFAQGKLDQVCSKVRISAPCVLYLENVELLGREQGHNENIRLIDTFETSMRGLQMGKYDPYALLIVGSTHLKASDLVPAMARLFIHSITFEAPTIDEAYLNLKWLLKRSNMICSSEDLSKVAEKTRGYVFADLVLLIHHAIHFRNCDANFVEENRRVLHIEHFDRGIEIMEAAYSDSIGAARVPNVRWEDIGGLEELKEEIMLTLNLPIEHPQLFTSLLKRSGILLYGPPGTGKTLMAKAVANECNYNFLSVKGPELMNMYVGQSEKNVREVFERAREASPCIIFFDELDSLAPSRGKCGESGGVADRVVSQLLAEMDGLDKNKGVFVIAATNRPDLIDSALLRPGRFDKMFYVGVCKDEKSKLSVLKALTRRFNLGRDVDFKEVITALPGQVTGADLYSVCSNAWFAAARRAINNIENGVDVSLPLEIFSEDFSEAVSQFVPSLTAEDMRYYETLKSS